MAMMKCSFCKFDVPRGAIVCAHCNADISYEFSFEKFFNRAIIFGFIGLAIAVVVSSLIPAGWWNFLVMLAGLCGGIIMAQDGSYLASAKRDGKTIAIDET